MAKNVVLKTAKILIGKITIIHAYETSICDREETRRIMAGVKSVYYCKISVDATRVFNVTWDYPKKVWNVSEKAADGETTVYDDIPFAGFQKGIVNSGLAMYSLGSALNRIVNPSTTGVGSSKYKDALEQIVNELKACKTLSEFKAIAAAPIESWYTSEEKSA